jgi:hypothetical protein
LPKVIQPPGGRPTKESNAVLVQFGFLEPLNYNFVSGNEDAISQMFNFIPPAVTYTLSVNDIKMQSIQPYDTAKSLKYVTTLVMFYIPADSVSLLSIALHTPSSPLFNHPDARVKTLMTFINPSIPLIAGQQMGEVVSQAQASAAAYPGAANGADPFGTDSQITSPVNTTSAAIAAPVAIAGLVYGCAMILVARRYSQKRQKKHKRSSSVTGQPAWMADQSQMSQSSQHSPRTYAHHVSPGLDGSQGSRDSRGSRGTGNTGDRSVRTQQISAPLTSANSLGWN